MRTLTKKDLILYTRTSYLNYMHNRGRKEGVCFGGTLYWAIEAMRFAGKNRPIKNVLYRDAQKFYEYALHVHDNYRQSKNPKSGLAGKLKSIVKMLNDQEELSYKREKYNHTDENKLKYFLVNGNQAKTIISRIINDYPGYTNTAIVIGVRLEKNLPPAEAFSHCAAIINYDNKNYFYDINTGVYYLSSRESHLFNSDSLVSTLAETFELTDPYSITKDKHHIFIITNNEVQNKASRTVLMHSEA